MYQLQKIANVEYQSKILKLKHLNKYIKMRLQHLKKKMLKNYFLRKKDSI